MIITDYIIYEECRFYILEIKVMACRWMMNIYLTKKNYTNNYIKNEISSDIVLKLKGCLNYEKSK